MVSLAYFSPEPDREGHASYTHVHEIIDGLTRRGWAVTLSSPKYSSVALPGIAGRLLGIGGAVLRCIGAGHRDVVYMRWHFAAFPVAMWAMLRRIPMFVEVNGPTDDLYIAWPFTKRFRWLFEGMMQRQLDWSAGIIAVTPGLEAMSRDRVPSNKPVTTVPNGANVEKFSPSGVSVGTALAKSLPDKFMIFFGSMAPWQGIDTILSALTLPSWPSDVHLVFAGDGQRRPVVEEAAREHGHVHYIGRVPYDELPVIVARAMGSFVSMEDTDGRAQTGLAPLKLFESLASGIPVIATDLPFQADVVRLGGCGIVVPPADPASIAEAVESLSMNAEAAKAMGAKARKVAVEQHSWDARAAQTANFLNDVLDQGT